MITQAPLPHARSHGVLGGAGESMSASLEVEPGSTFSDGAP